MVPVLSVLLLACGGGAPAPAPEIPNEVVVLGMIHGDHRTSERYSTAVLRAILTRVAPDRVLAEIPPDRFVAAETQFGETGGITEERVVRFPEYVDVLFPMARDSSLTLVPTAAWTESMAKARQKRMAELESERPEDWAAYEAAMAEMEATLAGREDDPAFIHTAEYDAIIARGMGVYDERFSRDLGPGGWSAINAAPCAIRHRWPAGQ